MKKKKKIKIGCAIFIFTRKSSTTRARWLLSLSLFSFFFARERKSHGVRARRWLIVGDYSRFIPYHARPLNPLFFAGVALRINGTRRRAENTCVSGAIGWIKRDPQ